MGGVDKFLTHSYPARGSYLTLLFTSYVFVYPRAKFVPNSFDRLLSKT